MSVTPFKQFRFLWLLSADICVCENYFQNHLMQPSISNAFSLMSSNNVISYYSEMQLFYMHVNNETDSISSAISTQMHVYEYEYRVNNLNTFQCVITCGRLYVCSTCVYVCMLYIFNIIPFTYLPFSQLISVLCVGVFVCPALKLP